MEVDSESSLLARVAAGAAVESDAWPTLRSDMLARLDEIAHNEFPIPKLPPPAAPRPPASDGRESPLPSSPAQASSQEANKDAAPAELPATNQTLEPGQLPKQIVDMLNTITAHIQTFDSCPPHTIQRLAELVLQPRAHYRALAPYLHAVDRVALVTSGTATYPLPPPIPDLSSIQLNGGDDAKDPAVSVAWSNPTNAALGTDEALGGALLTPIPWLTRRSPDSGRNTPGAQIHSESTETIDGPNGMGSIETVSVSVNGVPSTGHTRGVTQGELLRQEQRAGVVPVSQLSRTQDVITEEERSRMEEDGEEGPREEEEETPHARGPEEIGVGDTGLQSATTSYVGEGGLETENIDVAAAVGRKHDGEEDEATAEQEAEGQPRERSASVESAGTKREADSDLPGEPAKKLKEDGDKKDEAEPNAPVAAKDEDSATKAAEPADDKKVDEADDKMETNEDKPVKGADENA